MRFIARTDIGKKYKSNEDFYVLPVQDKENAIENIDRHKGMLFVLCDGMGGGNAGEVAGKLTATWIMKDYYAENKSSKLLNLFKSTKNQYERLIKIINNVNKRIYDLSQEYKQYNGMGTTLVASLFIGDNLYINSVGDSRCYLLRNSKLMQLTEDQSEVWKLYKMGAITKDEIRKHPRNNIITMAVGIQEDIEINEYKYKIKKNDIYLMCSDGLSDMVSENKITTILASSDDLDKKADNLIKAANNEGGKDNITAIIIEV